MTSVLFTLGRCEAVSLDSVLSNGDIVCFAPSLDSAIDRSRLTTGTTGGTTGTTATREGDSVSTAERSTSPSAAERQSRPQSRAPSRASSPREIALEDGCEIERGASSWRSCEHCLPLPGDPLTCTLVRVGGRVEGTVHRGGPDGRLRACKQLRRQLADG